MKKRMKERLKKGLVKLLAAAMVVGCFDGISFSSGAIPGSRVEAAGADTGNEVTNHLQTDYAIAFNVNETPKFEQGKGEADSNIKRGDYFLFTPRGVSAGNTTKIFGACPSGSALMQRADSQIYNYGLNYSSSDFVADVVDAVTAPGFDTCEVGSFKDEKLTTYRCGEEKIMINVLNIYTEVKGRSYVMDKVPYYQKVKVTLERNGEAWYLKDGYTGKPSGANSANDFITAYLKADGRYFPLTNNGDGTFTSDYVMVGTYEIWVNYKYNGEDENTGYKITVDNTMDRVIPAAGVEKAATTTDSYEVKWLDGNWAFCSKNTPYEATVNYEDKLISLRVLENFKGSDGSYQWVQGFYDKENVDAEKTPDYVRIYNKDHEDPNTCLEDITGKIWTDNSLGESYYLKLMSMGMYHRYDLYVDLYGAITETNSFVYRNTKAKDLSTTSSSPSYLDLVQVQLNIRSDAGRGEAFKKAFVSLRTEDGCDVVNLQYNQEATEKANAAYAGELGNTKAIYSFTALMLPDYGVPNNENNEINYYDVFVDGQDVHTQLAPSAHSVTSRMQTVDFYTLTVPVSLDKEPCTSADITATNGSEKYTLATEKNADDSIVTETVDGYTYALWKADVFKNDAAPNYTVKIRPSIDDGDILTVSNSGVHTLPGQKYYSVNFKKSAGTADTDGNNHRTQRVEEGSSAVEPDEPYKAGSSFDSWKKRGEDEAYDFSSQITEKTIIDPVFNEPTVLINGFMRTDANGNFQPEGTCFVLPNLTLEGFSKDEDAIQSMLVEVSNMDQIIIKPSETVATSLSQGSGVALTAVDNMGTKSATSKTVSIHFTKPVSMLMAQNYIRDNFIFVPQKDDSGKSVTSEVRVSASDGNMNTTPSTNSITVNVYNQTWQPISGGSKNRTTLYSGYYYLTGNPTYYPSGSPSSGLKISGTVYIYLNGYTLTSSGSSGSGTTPGGAGIELSSGNTLYLIGRGTVKASGGSAGGGSKGGSGSSNGNSGGSGGSGGGGAGAGIGTAGGSGGSGGSGGYKSSGTSGSSGGSASPAGSVYRYNVTMIVSGGMAGGGGDSGSNGGNLGGGGGGGGGGAAGYQYGSGGGGGAGGGGGGGKESKDCAADKAGTGGKGGGGGRGASSGGSGKDGRKGSWGLFNGTSSKNTGGSGGSGGGASSGRLGQYDVTRNVTYYSVTFQKAKSDGTVDYNFINTDKSKFIVVPEYAVTSKSEYFLGWRIKTVGKTINTGYELTQTGNQKMYQPGDVIEIKPGTYGNIVFQALLEQKIGNNATSEYEQIPALKSGTPTKYYLYEVRSTLDGVPASLGKNYSIQVNDTFYKLSIDSDMVIEGGEGGNTVFAGSNSTILTFPGTYEIFADGESTGLKVTGVEYDDTVDKASVGTEVPYESLRVYVQGHTPETVKLIRATEHAENPPTLKLQKESDKEGYSLYRYERQIKDYTDRVIDLPTDSYYVLVDGAFVMNAGDNCSWNNVEFNSGMREDRAIVTYDKFSLVDGTKTTYYYYETDGSVTTRVVYALAGEKPKEPATGLKPVYLQEKNGDDYKFAVRLEGTTAIVNDAIAETGDPIYVYQSSQTPRAISFKAVMIDDAQSSGQQVHKSITIGDDTYYAYNLQVESGSEDDYIKNGEEPVEVYVKQENSTLPDTAKAIMEPVYTNERKIVTVEQQVIDKNSTSRGEVRLDYATITVDIGGNGKLDSVSIKEIKENGYGKVIYLDRAGATNSRIFTTTGMLDTAETKTQYALFINGRPVYETTTVGTGDEATTQKVNVQTNFGSSQTVRANAYDVNVVTRLDNIDASVPVETIQVNGNPVIQGIGTGTYTYSTVSGDNSTIFAVTAGEDIKLPQFVLDTSSTSAVTKYIDYYTVTFHDNIPGSEDNAAIRASVPSALIVAKGHEAVLPGFSTDREETREGENITIYGDIPVRKGYSFLGWSAASNAETPTYTLGMHEILVTQKTDLYAIWHSNTSINGTVTFNYGGKDENGNLILAGPEETVSVGEGETAKDIYTRKTYAVVKLEPFNAKGEKIAALGELDNAAARWDYYRLVRPLETVYTYSYDTIDTEVVIDVKNAAAQGQQENRKWEEIYETDAENAAEAAQNRTAELIKTYLERKKDGKIIGGQDLPDQTISFVYNQKELYDDYTITDANAEAYLKRLLGEEVNQDGTNPGYVTTEAGTGNGSHVVGRIASPLTGASYSYTYYDTSAEITETINVPATPTSLGENNIKRYFDDYKAAEAQYNSLKNDISNKKKVLKTDSSIPESIDEPAAFKVSYKDNENNDQNVNITIDNYDNWDADISKVDDATVYTFTCESPKSAASYPYTYYDVHPDTYPAPALSADGTISDSYKTGLNAYIEGYQTAEGNSDSLEIVDPLSVVLTENVEHKYQTVKVPGQQDIAQTLDVTAVAKNESITEEQKAKISDFLTTYDNATTPGHVSGMVVDKLLCSDLAYGQYSYTYDTGSTTTQNVMFKTENYKTGVQKYKALVQNAEASGSHISNVTALVTTLSPLISYKYSYYASTQKVQKSDAGFATTYVTKKLASVGNDASVDILKDLSSGQLTYTYMNYNAPQTVPIILTEYSDEVTVDTIKNFFDAYETAKSANPTQVEDGSDTAVTNFEISYSYQDSGAEGGTASGSISYGASDWDTIMGKPGITISYTGSCSYNYITSPYTEETVTIPLVGENGADISSAVDEALLTYKELLSDGKIVSGKELQLDVNTVSSNDFFYFKNRNDINGKEVSFDDFGESASSSGFGGNAGTVAKAIEKYNELARYGAISTELVVSTPKGQYSFTNLPGIHNGETVVYQVSLASDVESMEFIRYLENEAYTLEGNYADNLISKRDETGTLDKFYSVETSSKQAEITNGNVLSEEKRAIQTDFILNYQPATQKVKVVIDTDGTFQNTEDHLPTQIQVELSGENTSEVYSLNLYPRAIKDGNNITGYTYEGSLNISAYVDLDKITEMAVTKYKFGSRMKNPETVEYLTYRQTDSTVENGIKIYHGILAEKLANITFANGTDETVTNMPNGTAVFLGKNYMLPVNVPVRMGYEFMGWKVGAQTYQPGDSLTVNDDVTFTATWRPHSYTVTYKGMEDVSGWTYNNQESPENLTTFTYEQGGTFNVGVPQKSRYIFDGWEATGATIQDVSQSDFTAIVPKDEQRNVTLTATWRNASIVLILYEGMEEGRFVDSSGNETQKVSFYQEETVQEIPAAERTGYIFKGWTVRKDGSNWKELYNGERGSTEIPETTCKELVLVAKWEPRKYDITYGLTPYWEGDTNQNNSNLLTKVAYTLGVAENGEETKTVTTKHVYDTRTLISDPTNTDKYYKFAGWTWEDHPNAEKNLIIGERDYTSTITLSSTWEPETWEIEYSAGKDANGKKVADATFAADNPEEYLYATAFKADNDKITNQITNPVREGYKFTGWTVQQQYQVFVPKVTRKLVSGLPLVNPTYEYTASETEGTWETVTVDVVASQLKFTEDTYTDITENGSTEKIGEELHSGNLQIKNAFVVENAAAGIVSNLTQEQLQQMYDGTASYYTQNTKAKLILTANWEPYKYDLIYHVDYSVANAQDPRATANTYNGKWGVNAGWTTDNTVTGSDNKKVVKQYASDLKLIGFDDATKPLIDSAMADLVNPDIHAGYSFIGWSDTKPNYVLNATDAESAGGVTAQPEENYYIQAGYYQTGDEKSITYTRNGRYDGDTLNLYAVFERDVQLDGTITFKYTNTSIYDTEEPYDVITAEGSQIVKELKLTVKRINVLTGKEDKTWTPTEYEGKKTQTISVALAEDGKSGTAIYNFGTYPRADENGIYRYEITAEPIKNYVEERTLTIYPGQVNFTETYAPDRFKASWNIALLQGTADTQDIPAAIKVMPMYFENGEWVDVEERFIAELTYNQEQSVYTGEILLPERTAADADGECKYSYRLYEVGYEQSEETVLDWTSIDEVKGLDFAMGTTGVSKARNKTMTGTITLHDIHPPVIRVTYTPGETAKVLTTGKITLDTPVAMTITATDSHLKSVAYYWGQPSDPSAARLDAKKWQSITNGDCVVPKEGAQVLYVKAVDEDGNVSYFRSGPITVSETPAIGGVIPGKEPQEYYPGDIKIPGSTPSEGSTILPIPGDPNPESEFRDWEFMVDLVNREVLATDGDGNHYVWKPNRADPNGTSGTLTVTDKDGNTISLPEELSYSNVTNTMYHKERGSMEYTDGDGKVYFVHYDIRRDPVIGEVKKPNGDTIQNTDPEKQKLIEELTGDDNVIKAKVHYNPENDPNKTYDIDLPDNQVSITNSDDITYTFIPQAGTLVWTEKEPGETGETYKYTYDPSGDNGNGSFTRIKVNPDGTPIDNAQSEAVPEDKLNGTVGDTTYKASKKAIYDDLKANQLPQDSDGSYRPKKPGYYEIHILDKYDNQIGDTIYLTILSDKKFGDETQNYPENPNGWKDPVKDQNGEEEKERTGKDGSTERITQGLLDPEKFPTFPNLDRGMRLGESADASLNRTNTYTKTVNNGPGAPATRVKNSVQELILAILNLRSADGSVLPAGDADYGMVSGIASAVETPNSEVDILTTVETRSESQLSAAQRNRISAMYEQLGGEKIAYMDIRMKAIVTISGGSTTEYPITRTASKISFSIDVPDSLKDVPSGYTRSYMVLRDHGTKTTALTGWVKATNGKLEFKSDLFSPYAVICKDTRNLSGIISDIGDSIKEAVQDVWNSIFAPEETIAEKKVGKKNAEDNSDNDNLTEEEPEKKESSLEDSVEDEGNSDDDDRTVTNGSGTFAIMNLILTLATVLVIARAFLKKKKWFANLVVAIVTAILLIMTTGISKVVFVNLWTIAFAVLFVMQLGIYYFMNNNEEEVEDE